MIRFTFSVKPDGDVYETAPPPVHIDLSLNDFSLLYYATRISGDEYAGLHFCEYSGGLYLRVDCGKCAIGYDTGFSVDCKESTLPGWFSDAVGENVFENFCLPISRESIEFEDGGFTYQIEKETV